ncbi:Ribosomal RNA small subunit methyltransferase D [Buchnera aphidicola (Phyllaphis fagi)]|uniref:16S rRNA (guanine(966)-N(2))-methyltransferase RsmD n=1 Tax=Buchnera aphidicola TaxID=9 RepID=UPI0034647999
MKNQNKKKKIRIISGYLKGQIIQTINNNNLRPTLHRIRETLFNWLILNIKDSYCLDCFSGSGALGIESISRYASYVTCLESNKNIIKNLRKNIYRLQINNINIIHTDALIWLKKNTIKYNIIFLDPPYQKYELQKIIFLLHKTNIIKYPGYVYIEQSKYKSNNIQYPKNWNLFKQKFTKKIHYKLYMVNKY